MPRVSAESLKKLNEFFDSLPEEARNKCALCNETLTHIVKQAEAQTGAGTATVTRELAERINDGAAEGDKVSGGALQHRVHNAEHGRRPSEKDIIAQCNNNTQPNQAPPSESTKGSYSPPKNQAPPPPPKPAPKPRDITKEQRDEDNRVSERFEAAFVKMRKEVAHAKIEEKWEKTSRSAAKRKMLALLNLVEH